MAAVHEEVSADAYDQKNHERRGAEHMGAVLQQQESGRRRDEDQQGGSDRGTGPSTPAGRRFIV